MSTTMTDEQLGLRALRAADFDWATRLQDVWRDPVCDVPDLHRRLRREFDEEVARLAAPDASTSPLGWVLVGEGGSGKTHLLSAFRRTAFEHGATFVLVDMTDVRDFWDTLLQAYLDSLAEDVKVETPQQRRVLERVVGRIASNDCNPEAYVHRMSEASPDRLPKYVQEILKALAKVDRPQTQRHADVIRAFVCLNSEDFGVANVGRLWLQGQELEEDERRSLGFGRSAPSPHDILKGLSWLCSLSGPTVTAFDQLDPIVYQYARFEHPDEEERETAWQIVQGIGRGLLALRDTLADTLPVVTCVESTWERLREAVMRTAIDRFQPPRQLDRPDGTANAALIRGRLQPAFAASEFTPPYDTWPFTAGAIAELSNVSPREVLKLCDGHRRRCLEAGSVTELDRFDGTAETPPPPADDSPFDALDAEFANLRGIAQPDELLDEKREDDRLGPLIVTALDCLRHEHEAAIPADVDAVVEPDFTGGNTGPALHARLRVVRHAEGGREEHYCVRALQRTHARAFQTRLKAAMTQSGIDRALKFRHLVLVRANDTPGGAVTARLLESFRSAGGRIHQPDEDELRTLFALHELRKRNDPRFHEWLRSRRPLTSRGLNSVLAPGSLLNGDTGGNGRSDGDDFPPDVPPPTAPAAVSPREEPTVEATPPAERVTPVATTPVPAAPAPAPPPSTDGRAKAMLPLGRRLLGMGRLGEVVDMPPSLLSRHAIVLGGSGSGKTVTVRRIVEEAALLGIPSIVVDCAQDMATFDERLDDTRAEHWQDGDRERCAAFHAKRDMVVWTPGKPSGNPLVLQPLPDFAALRGDEEELEAAVLMVEGALGNVVASGSGKAATNKQGLLSSSLRYFARHCVEGSLTEYAALLEALPAEAGLGLSREDRLATEMADSLKVEVARDPLLRSEGTPLDPAMLFGDHRESDRTRISVISLVGLPTLELQRSFVNQLAMLLFSWIKRNPQPPGDRPLRGLLVIDEARDFVPSQRSTACKESVMRLAAQGRKYGLGLLLATQHPKDVETRIVGNCATHLYGRNDSPASLDTLQDLMRQRGASGNDIARLEAGQFYFSNADAGHPAPVKIKIPHSFTPSRVLEERELATKATSSR